MATLSKLRPGDILYDVHSERAGNTTMRRQGEWTVRVIEVHDDHAMCSWNGNPATKYRERDLKKLRVKPAAKLNGHIRACPRSKGIWGWGNECKCPG